VDVEKRSLMASREEHQRLLHAFVAAATTGDLASIRSILAEDVVLVADAGPAGGTYGKTRNLPEPLVGRDKVAAFVVAVGPQGAGGVSASQTELNGQPAIVVSRDGRPFTVIMLAVVDGTIRSIFMHADLARLRRVKGPKA
jgi:RNA polymerase sigma-70 factor (ECF subfamily)